MGEYELGFQILFEARRLGLKYVWYLAVGSNNKILVPFNTILVSLIQRLFSFHQNPSILATQLFETEQL